MQNETPASLPIGTHVSAKYKGAFCEAKVRSVVKQVKCRVTFKFGYGSTTLSDEYIRCASPLAVGSSVTARHPDKQEYLEATINKIQDQSLYTVVFDDGDITTLRRNALCIKSGKHYNASESLDNLPLTHPEHFSTPVAGSRRKKGAAGGSRDSGDEYESSSDNEDTSYTSSSYVANIGRVVWAENTDKKCKAREAWFPALIVAPSASGTVKIDIKEEYLIRSFKDGRYYTVTKKDTTRFHRDSIRKPENAHMRDTLEKAVTYLEKNELPPLWDREVLFSMGDGSTTESSESEEIDDEIEEDEESPEAKDHLVAELYKHMEDRGSPINRTPSIDNRDLDLGRLFRMVVKLGGHNRVTNNNLWRKVAQKLGFDTMWCINQVRVHYKRYLQSFEELYRTLGVTMVNHPTSRSTASVGATASVAVGGRAQIRGKHRSGTAGAKDKDSANSDADSEKPGDETTEIAKTSTRADNDKKKTAEEAKQPESSEKKKGKVLSTPTSKDKKPARSEATPDSAPPTAASSATTPSASTPSATPPAKKGRPSAGGDDAKMTTRPRRDSTSSLAAAMQVKAQKDSIGDGNLRKANPVVRMDRDQNAENELRKIQAARSPKANKGSEEIAPGTPAASAPPPPSATTPVVSSSASPPSSSTVTNGGRSGNGSDTSAAGDSDKSRVKKKPGKKSVKTEDEESNSASTLPAPVGDAEPETEKQHLPPHVDVDVGDRIKVFYKQNTIYEAKVIRSQVRPGEKWPRFLVHYQGWNARYDEWIKRFRIAENLSWSKDRVKQPRPPEGAVDSPGAETLSAQAQPQPQQQQQQPPQQQQQPQQLQRESPRTTRKDLIRKERSEKLVARSRGRTMDTPATGSSPRATTPSSRGGSRTASPASLKRQSSRSSTRKESEESEEENDSEDSSRKSRRLRTGNTPAAAVDHRKMSAAGSSRKRLAAKEDSEAEDVDVEKDYEATTAPAHKPKRSRLKASQTPDDSGSEEKGSVSSSSADTPSRSVTTRGSERTARQPLTPKAAEKRARAKGKSEEDDDEEDPYAFKEPDNDVTGTPRKGAAAATASGQQTPSTRKQQQQQQAPTDAPTADATQGKDLSRQSASKRKLSSRLRGESDSADSGSDESGSKKSKTAAAVSKGSSENENPEVKSEPSEEKASSKEDMLPKGEIETCQAPSDDVKTEADANKTSEKQSEAGKPVLQLTKKQQELFPFLSAIRTTTVADVSGAGGRTASKAAAPSTTASTSASARQGEATKSDTDADDRKPPERSAKKRKDPRKPKSSEIAESESESEQNSDSENSKTKPAAKSKSVSASSRQKGRSVGEPAGDEDSQRRAATGADKRGKAKKEDADDLDLACGETIPGSPVHPSSSSASTADQRPASGHKSGAGGATRLEMPFASVPESVHGPAPQSESTAVAGGRSANAVPATLPPRRAYDSKLRDDATDCSSVSQSPRELRPEGSKSPVDSSEVDMDSLSGRKAESEDSRLDVESSLTEQRKSASSMRKSAQQNSFSSAASAAGKRKRKSTREAALAASSRGGRGGGRGLHGSGRGHDEPESLEERKNAMLLSLDNDELAALTQKSPKSKYNFFVPLESGLDSTERISRIQTSLEELRKTYLSLKSDLAVIERRRKKIRRKERERGGSSSAAASPAVESAA